VVVENAPFGIESAKKAGAFCVAVTSTLEATYLSAADLIFPDLQAIRENLDVILEKAEKAGQLTSAEMIQK
jgi:beta-phosphoglucomutase-like phosphatase (HAD superfamily)